MTFLTTAELVTLTGYVRPAKQREWLSRAGVHFFVSGSGRPVVLREALHERTICRPNGTQAHPRLRLTAAALPARR